LYFWNSFTWSKALGIPSRRSKLAWLLRREPQNIRNLAAERGLSSFDVRVIKRTSVVIKSVGRAGKYGSP